MQRPWALKIGMNREHVRWGSSVWTLVCGACLHGEACLRHVSLSGRLWINLVESSSIFLMVIRLMISFCSLKLRLPKRFEFFWVLTLIRKTHVADIPQAKLYLQRHTIYYGILNFVFSWNYVLLLTHTRIVSLCIYDIILANLTLI